MQVPMFQDCDQSFIKSIVMRLDKRSALVIASDPAGLVALLKDVKETIPRDGDRRADAGLIRLTIEGHFDQGRHRWRRWCW